LESFRSFRGPLILKPVTGQELFFVVSYSKPALTSLLRKGNWFTVFLEKLVFRKAKEFNFIS
jgi:hypothetical protein